MTQKYSSQKTARKAIVFDDIDLNDIDSFDIDVVETSDQMLTNEMAASCRFSVTSCSCSSSALCIQIT